MHVSLFFAALALSSGAQAAPKPNVTGSASVSASSVAAGSPTQFTSQMCNAGTTSVGSVFMGSYLPTGLAYTLVSTTKASACHNVLSGSYYYFYCVASLLPGECADVTLSATASTPGTYTLYSLADSANILRESNELDNRGQATFSAY